MIAASSDADLPSYCILLVVLGSVCRLRLTVFFLRSCEEPGLCGGIALKEVKQHLGNFCVPHAAEVSTSVKQGVGAVPSEPIATRLQPTFSTKAADTNAASHGGDSSSRVHLADALVVFVGDIKVPKLSIGNSRKVHDSRLKSRFTFLEGPALISKTGRPENSGAQEIAHSVK